jgi:hypothetical protein
MNCVTEKGLNTTIEALATFERMLFDMHRSRDKYHPQQYTAFAEGLADEICKLRAQIDAAIGLTEFATSSRLHRPMPVVPEFAVSYEPPAADVEQQTAPARSAVNGQP